eukprot:440017-Rhodomonas_salina.1
MQIPAFLVQIVPGMRFNSINCTGKFAVDCRERVSSAAKSNANTLIPRPNCTGKEVECNCFVPESSLRLAIDCRERERERGCDALPNHSQAKPLSCYSFVSCYQDLEPALPAWYKSTPTLIQTCSTASLFDARHPSTAQQCNLLPPSGTRAVYPARRSGTEVLRARRNQIPFPACPV